MWHNWIKQMIKTDPRKYKQIEAYKQRSRVAPPTLDEVAAQILAKNTNAKVSSPGANDNNSD